MLERQSTRARFLVREKPAHFLLHLIINYCIREEVSAGPNRVKNYERGSGTNGYTI